MTISLLPGLLDQAERRWPDRPAITAESATLTYRQLAEAARRAACWLGEVGCRPGDRIVISARSALVTTVLAWGAAQAGVVFTVTHEQVRNGPLRHLLSDCDPSLVVSDDPAVRETAHQAGWASLAPLNPTGPPADGERPRILSVDPACMIYTSGSTSLPKAVVSTHGQMVFAATAIASVLHYRPDDVVYCPLPLSFDYGLYQLLLGTLSGARIWLAKPAEVGPALLTNLCAARATVLAAVPAIAESLARLLQRSPAQAPPLRLITNTGAAMHPQVLAALRKHLPSLRVQLMFGLTECKRATIMPPDGDLARPGSCGLPLPGTAVVIIDDDGRPLPPGEVGQIVVRGPHVMSGYWRQPELTAQRFPRAEGLLPELHTGDYGWLDEEGYLYFAGRRDDIYKAAGYRVSATEVEAAAMRVPGVDSAAVLLPAPDHPVTLVAVASLTAAELITALREELEEFKIPQRCEIVSSLPLTGNGKVDKKALAASLREAVDA
jgi:acyl-CoA synthetase (AMP-forming)/AMP-acid ligase II